METLFSKFVVRRLQETPRKYDFILNLIFIDAWLTWLDTHVAYYWFTDQCNNSFVNWSSMENILCTSYMLTAVLRELALLLSSLVYLPPEMGTFLRFQVLLRWIYLCRVLDSLEIMFSNCLVLGLVMLATVLWVG